MSKVGQDHAGEIQRQLSQASGSSWTLDQWLESWHGTYLGPLLVSNSCVACFIGSGIRIYPWYMRWLLETHSLWWGACSILVLSELNVSLLTPHGRPYPF